MPICIFGIVDVKLFRVFNVKAICATKGANRINIMKNVVWFWDVEMFTNSSIDESILVSMKCVKSGTHTVQGLHGMSGILSIGNEIE